MAKARPTLLCFAMLITAAAPARAETDTEHQIWTAGFLHVRPSRNAGFLGWLDVHDRRRENSSLVILRPALGYQVLERLAVYVGYAWIGTLPDMGANRSEHRVWQQALLNLPAPAGWAFSLRPRLEQRFAEGGDDTGHRARFLGRAAVTPSSDVPLLLVVWDEVFYQLNDTDWGAQSGFDQNRLFAGIGIPALPGSRVEVGYLNAFLDRFPNNQMDHSLAINLFYNY